MQSVSDRGPTALTFLWLACLVATLPGLALAQTIAVSHTPEFASCNWVVSPRSSYIVVQAPFAGGLTGAEFSVQGLPDANYAVTVTPNPMSIFATGNPFEDGCTILFADCQQGDAVLLYTVEIVRLNGPPEVVHLNVESHSTPSSPNFSCPLITLCDGPVFTRLCVPEFGSSTMNQPLAHTPNPPDGAQQVRPGSNVLIWEETPGPYSCCGIGTGFRIVEFGASNPPPMVSRVEDSDPAYSVNAIPRFLEANTTYYWRIRKTTDGDCGTTDGPIWSFTTGDFVGVEVTAWDAVKQMFR